MNHRQLLSLYLAAPCCATYIQVGLEYLPATRVRSLLQANIATMPDFIPLKC